MTTTTTRAKTRHKKVNLPRCFKIHRSSSIQFNLSNTGEFFLRRCLVFTSSTKRKNQVVSRRSRVVTAKKCTKQRDTRAKLLFCPLNPLLFCRSCCRRRRCCLTSLVSSSNAAASSFVRLSLPEQRLPTLMPQELGQREPSIVLNLHEPLFAFRRNDQWL